MRVTSSSHVWLTQLRATRLEAVLVPERSWTLGRWPEATLRGALGRALFQLACLRDDRDCRSCRWRLDCPISCWFEPQLAGISRPSCFVPRALHAPGAELGPERPLRMAWTFLLLPPRPSLFLEALVRAARLGLDGVSHRVARVQVYGKGAPTLVLADERALGDWPEPSPLAQALSIPRQVRGLRLRFERPFQRKGGRPPSPADVVDAAIQRARGVARLQGASILHRWPSLDGLQGSWEGLRQERGTRASASQQGERMPLGGWLGTLRLGPEVAGFTDLLAAAELLHIGRKTSFGLGRLALDWELEGRPD